MEMVTEDRLIIKTRQTGTAQKSKTESGKLRTVSSEENKKYVEVRNKETT